MGKIFVKTGNLNNKGDMLMLLAIAQRYGEKHEIVVLPSSCCKDMVQKIGILFCRPHFTSSRKSPAALFKNLLKSLLNAAPDILLRRFGYVSPRNISLVLDASGFAYGDCWGSHKITTAISMYSSFKGVSVVFMPQSYGPFNSPLLKSCMKDLLCGSPMIYARDRSSYNHIAPLAPSSADVVCSPDFTFDVSQKRPWSTYHYDHYVVFMPSHRVAEKIGEEKVYSFYKNSFDAAKKSNYDIIFVAHDTKHDYDLSESLRLFLGIETPTVALNDVREIRWVISNSALVVGSRFHGLVNALSQGVPAIGLGWTHKFDCLFEDYGIGEFVVKDEDDFMMLSRMVHNLLDSKNTGTREAVLSTIRKNREVLRDRSNTMWKRLDDIVGTA